MDSYNLTLENVKQGIKQLEDQKIPIDRPSDYLVEMMKSDVQMKKVKQRLLAQEENISKFEERKRRVHDKKYSKKVCIYIK